MGGASIYLVFISRVPRPVVRDGVCYDFPPNSTHVSLHRALEFTAATAATDGANDAVLLATGTTADGPGASQNDGINGTSTTDSEASPFILALEHEPCSWRSKGDVSFLG